MSKSAPCFKRAGVIERYHVAISHVTGSRQDGRVLHEVIIFTLVANALRGPCALRMNVVYYIESHVMSVYNPFPLPALRVR